VNSQQQPPKPSVIKAGCAVFAALMLLVTYCGKSRPSATSATTQRQATTSRGAVATEAPADAKPFDAVAAFPTESVELAAEVQTIAGMIAKRDWEYASMRAQAARTRLSAFAGTTVATSKAWLDLDQRLRAQQKLIEPEMQRIDAKKQAAEATANAARGAVQAEADARGPMPLDTGGGYLAVDFFMKERLKDPGSYEPSGCSPARAEGAFWVATCTYRAKNSFGALVLESGRFFMQKGGFAGEGEVARMEAIR